MTSALANCPNPAPVALDANTIRIRESSPADREPIYRLRHDVYAVELGQHRPNAAAQLRTELDDVNHYLVAETAFGLAGFVSITPPGKSYSIDRYLSRADMPFAVDGGLYEIRLLTVSRRARRGPLATLLMFAALRWVAEHGGTHVVCLGRKELLRLYGRVGWQRTGIEVRSGAVAFELLHAGVAALEATLGSFRTLLRRLESRVSWELGFPYLPLPACFHGGAFFEAVGESFDRLERRQGIINADVLDAWFPPAQRALDLLHENLAWLAQTSPPTAARGLVETIARVRGVEPPCVLPGGGSSDLIFLAFRQWLNRGSRVLLLDPTYGEYAHVLETLIGCRVDRLRLRRGLQYDVGIEKLSHALTRRYDLVVLVNPNSPTGRHVERRQLEDVLRQCPAATRVWVDETYVDYAGAGESIESFASRSRNVVVCKSMSKVYALSGLRAAYLCGPPGLVAELRAWTPPWAVGLLAQVAAVVALQEPEYYRARYDETHREREGMQRKLLALGLDPVPGRANFLLVHVPNGGPGAAALVARCRRRGLFLRDAGETSRRFRDRAFRVAVKDPETNGRILSILEEQLRAGVAAGPS